MALNEAAVSLELVAAAKDAVEDHTEGRLSKYIRISHETKHTCREYGGDDLDVDIYHFKARR